MTEPLGSAGRHAARLDLGTMRQTLERGFRLSLGPLAGQFADGLRELAATDFATALWKRRPDAWTADPEVQQKIAQRLGWLAVPRAMSKAADRLRTFANRVRADGITDVILLGMGGSSLAAEVFHQVIGVRPGFPRFHMLDSVDPDVVRAVDPPVATSLFLLASKSGSTLEPNVLAEYFSERLRAARGLTWPTHFVAITDEGSPLHHRAVHEGFRETFLNPADIGGRYSALSYFGLVPAALMGADLDAILAWATAMELACRPNHPITTNPGLALGLALGIGIHAGRDKVTLLLPSALDAFGLWVEQLVAESTGKQGAGVIPIVGEPVLPREAYGSDRLFVRFQSKAGGHGPSPRSEDGDPLVEIDLPEPAALGAEFMRWEIATATVGAMLHINPFDEPNVQQAKDATNRLLHEHSATGRLPAAAPAATVEGADLTLSAAAEAALGNDAGGFLRLLQPGDYFAILAYLPPYPPLLDALDLLRYHVALATRCATMFGFGPRYLHSTGQLHKGGPPSGVFLLLTAHRQHDVPILGKDFSFGVLEQAQALGDFRSLDDAGRRVLHVHLPSLDARALEAACTRLLRNVRGMSDVVS